MVPEYGPAHGMARDRGDLLVLGRDRGNLVFLFAGDFLFGESCVDQHVGQNVHAEPQVRFHHLDRNTEAVVSGIGADLPAHGFDLVVELLAVSTCRAFDQGAGGEGGHAIGPGGFGEKAAAEDGDEVDQREFAVLADQHAQSVGQGEALDPARPRGRGRLDRAVEGTFGIERGDGGLRFYQVLAGHALQVGGLDASDMPEIFGAEIRVAGQQPAPADVRGAAPRGGEVADLVGEDALPGLGHLAARGRLSAVTIDDVEHRAFRLGALFRLAKEVDAEETHFSRHVGVGGNVMDKVAFLAQFEVQGRAAASAQNGGQHIERGGVGVGDRRDMPDERATRQLGPEFLVRLAASELRWFVRDEKRRLDAPRRTTEPFFRLGKNLHRVDVAGHDEEHVLRGVAGAVVGGEVVAGQAVEDLEMPDDRVPVGAGAEGGREHEFGAHAVGIIEAHGELAADHLLFLGELAVRQGGVERGVGQKFDRGGRAVGRHIDPIDRAVEGGVGIDVAPGLLHGAGDLVGAAFFRALENHVLEQMGQSAAEPLAFMNAAALHPDLHAGHRGGVVGLDQHGETVGEHTGDGLTAGQRRGGRIGCWQELGHGRAARRPAALVGLLRDFAGARGAAARFLFDRTERLDESFLEAEPVLEVLDAVILGPAKDAGFDEIENHAADIAGGADAPIFEDGQAHRTELLERIFAESLEEFVGRDMG